MSLSRQRENGASSEESSDDENSGDESKESGDGQCREDAVGGVVEG